MAFPASPVGLEEVPVDVAFYQAMIAELRAQNAVLKKENRELVRANEILQSAASFFGAELDRQSRK